MARDDDESNALRQPVPDAQGIARCRFNRLTGGPRESSTP
jgi:hypothetical protein